MRLGCCVNMLGNADDPIGRRYIRAVKEAGYDYVELPLAQVMELSEQEFGGLLDELDAAALPCRCCNNFFPASVRLTGENADLAAAEDYIARAVKRAARLGAERIVFGSSGAKNVPEGFSHERAFEQIVEVLRLADRYVQPEHICIVIEPLNRKESNIILNLTDGERLVKAVDRPSVRLLVDYYHFRMEEESPEVLRQAMPDIRHVHFAEPQGRSFPTGESADYESFFEILREGNYTGGVSIEAYASCPKQELARAVLVRKYFEEN